MPERVKGDGRARPLLAVDIDFDLEACANRGGSQDAAVDVFGPQLATGLRGKDGPRCLAGRSGQLEDFHGSQDGKCRFHDLAVEAN